MAEGKYGRLFTERDVMRLIAYAFGPYVGAEGLIERYEADPDGIGGGEPSLTFPPDEPLFLLRAQDAAAPGALDGDGYLDECGRVGAPKGYWLNAAGRALEIREWQAQHPDRVKVPD